MSQAVSRSQVILAQCWSPPERFPIRVEGFGERRMQGIDTARLDALQAATEAFADVWPLAASSVSRVEIVSELAAKEATNEDFAVTITNTVMGRVRSRVQLLRSLFTDPDLDSKLKTWSEQEDIVASDIAGIWWHEAGHVLLNTLILRAEPMTRSAETGSLLVVQAALGKVADTTVGIKTEARRVSKRAMRSCEEFVAEAFSDFGTRGMDCHYLSLAIVSVIGELWRT